MAQKNVNLTGDLPVRWEGKTRILVAFFLVVGCALAFILISPVFTILAIGFIFSFILFFPVKSIAKRMPKHYALALVIVFLLVALVLAGVILGVAKNLVSQAQNLIDQLENVSISQIQSTLSSAGINVDQISSKISSSTLIKDLGGEAPSGDSASQLAGLVSSVLNALKGAILGAASGIANLFTGLVIGFLLMLNMHGSRKVVCLGSRKHAGGDQIALIRHGPDVGTLYAGPGNLWELYCCWFIYSFHSFRCACSTSDGCRSGVAQHCSYSWGHPSFVRDRDSLPDVGVNQVR
jgi:ABC-type multidrug transport system fused ATPase/permease subunit